MKTPHSILYSLMTDPEIVFVVTDGKGIRWASDRRVVTSVPLVREVFEGLPDGVYRVRASRPPVPVEWGSSLPALADTAAKILERDDWVPAGPVLPVVTLEDELHGAVLVLESVLGAPFTVRRKVHDAWCAFLFPHVLLEVTEDGRFVRYSDGAAIVATVPADVPGMFAKHSKRWRAAERNRDRGRSA
jgi:hypothetical protein